LPPYQTPWPFERPEQLIEALREQGETAAASLDLTPALQRLREWQVQNPRPSETQQLIARLTREMKAASPMRQAIRGNQLHPVLSMLAVARAQVTIFGLGFWLVSAFITLLGGAVVLSAVLPDEALVLRATGPLLAYLGTVLAFRGRDQRVLELELSCPPSPLQLAVARLLIVLGYDASLGLALSLLLWAGQSDQVLLLTLSWLMPLFLVTGLALILSLRLPVQAAASVAYVSWLAVVAVTAGLEFQGLLLAPELAVLGGAGIALVTVALLRMRPDLHRLLPQR
jgi:hypothetical protein